MASISLEQVDQIDIPALMTKMGEAARKAAATLALVSNEARNKALTLAAIAIRAHQTAILEANIKDIIAAEAKGLSSAMLDRLMLAPDRIEAMAAGIEAIARQDDPLGKVLTEWERPNGLKISRVSVPLGVIGIIYESRPNVTADAGALCLKSGNAVILRGGSESYHSSRAIHACLLAGLRAADLPKQAIQLVSVTDRDAVGYMLSDMAQYLDVLIPRGGKSLVGRVQAEARVPVLAHLEGLCHVYVDGAADLAMARAITVNAKMRRTGICGAAETLLIDRSCAGTFLGPIIADLLAAGCEVRGDAAVQVVDTRVKPAKPEDWDTEYLDSIISARVVDGVEGAIAHINEHSSNHTECIISESTEAVEAFMNEIDSAILLHNASTQFADGGEFGMGAEVGIATGKLHVRGPVGCAELTSYKYVVRGSGQTRP